MYIFGKIIKLSGRHAGTKTTKKRQWLAWKWTEKAPRKVKKVLDKITDTRYNIKARQERASLEKGAEH